MHHKISYFSCNEISFEPGSVPEYIKQSGINLFRSKFTSIQRIQQAIWFGSVSSKEKLIYATELSNDVNILSPGERLGNLFVLSFVHRCFSILTSSTKLYIDNSNIKPFYKYAASFALSAAPSLFLIFVVGYPPTDLILNACISQALSSVLSYCSLRVGNYIRSLDLISDTKEFSKTAYMSKVLVSSGIDILLTLAWHGKELYTDPFKKQDSYHILQYCMEKELSKRSLKDISMITMIYLSTPLISIADKLIWLTGRVAFDAIICGAHALGRVKDIRSPFIDAFSRMEKEHVKPVIVKEHTQGNKHKSSVHKSRDTDYNVSKAEKNIVVEVDRTIPYTSYDFSRSSTQEFRERKVQPKIKTRPSIPESSTDNTHGEEEQTKDQNCQAMGEMTIKGITFYKINGQHVPNNTWGVISLKKSRDDVEPYERSLASSGHVHNQRSAIKYINATDKYEIRPRSVGDRVLGQLTRGIQGFTALFLLGEAMDVYEQIKKAGNNDEPNLILFSKRVKHEAIGRNF